MVKCTEQPSPSLETIPMEPPCMFTMRLHSGRPMPEPWFCSSCSGRRNGSLSKTCLCMRWGIPGPSSRTVTVTFRQELPSPLLKGAAVTSTQTVFPSGENLTALLTRLLRTCSTRYLSPTTLLGTAFDTFFTKRICFSFASPLKLKSTLDTASLSEKGQSCSCNLPSSSFCMSSTSCKVSHMSSEAPFIICRDSRAEESGILLRIKTSVPIVSAFRGVWTSLKM
mmetsp:Transcript_2789/g.3873  ORF Transcript_2789/g.3873 Transcript_2789/m.3873 type:complete len:224 (-) Transcript_2789:675-1346(-)